ncbi:MAG: hypothetical protein OXG19_09720 [Chloroflexi bacterium]|nr:hypothetical protein [Chloroflexota bacterium]
MLDWLLGGIVGWWLGRKTRDGAERPSPRSQLSGEVTTRDASLTRGLAVEGHNFFIQAVAGESHYQPALQALLQAHGREPFRVALLAEPDNPYDRHAVRIIDLENRTLGWIPSEDARTLGPPIHALAARGLPVSCYGRILGGEGEKRHIGLWLDLDPDALAPDA